MSPTLVLVGLSHRTAPLAVRERLAVSPRDLPALLARLRARPGITECWVLSTCNRVEFLAAASEGGDGAAAESLERFVSAESGVAAENLRPHLYRHAGREAIAHLFRVASGLDSLVLGEPQILGQTKEAYHEARTAGTMGPVLDPLFQRTFSVAKRIRSETGIGRHSVSVASAAVDLALQIFGDLRGRSFLILGTGKMASLAGKALRSRGVSGALVATRQPEAAAAFAAGLGGTAIGMPAMPGALASVDIVIGSTAAPHPVLLRDHVEAALQTRRGRPLFLIDIAVPRDIEPEAGALDDVYLYTIDDLRSVVEGHRGARQGESEAAERIVFAETEEWAARERGAAAGVAIAELVAAAESLRREEMRRFRTRAGPLDPVREEQVEALSRSLVNKLLHNPITMLRRGERVTEDLPLAGALRTLFGLDDPDEAAAQDGDAGRPDEKRRGAADR